MAVVQTEIEKTLNRDKTKTIIEKTEKNDHVAKDSMCRDMIRTFGTYHDDE